MRTGPVNDLLLQDMACVRQSFLHLVEADGLASVARLPPRFLSLCPLVQIWLFHSMHASAARWMSTGSVSKQIQAFLQSVAEL